MRAWMVLTFVMALAACVEPEPEDLLVGDYELQTVDGQRVPFLVVAVPGIEIAQRRLRLDAAGSFTDLLVLRVEDEGTIYHVPLDLDGTYSVDERVVSFSYYTSGRVAHALWDGRELEMDDRGLSFVFRR